MKKALLFLVMCILVNYPAFAADEASIETEITTTAIAQGDFSSQLIDKIKAERNTIYNALNLTPEQINKKDEIEKKRYDALEPELRKLCLARKKLKNLEKSNDKSAQNTAQKEISATRKEIKHLSDKYDHEFKKILNSEQRAKYNTVRKLKRADLKRTGKKSNKKPALRPFGVPMTQAEYSKTNSHKNKSLNKKLFN